MSIVGSNGKSYNPDSDPTVIRERELESLQTVQTQNRPLRPGSRIQNSDSNQQGFQNHQPTHQAVYREPDPVPHPTVPPDLLDPTVYWQSDGTREALAARVDTYALLPRCSLLRAFSHENLRVDSHRNLKRDS